MSTKLQLTNNFVDLAMSRRLELAELLPCKAVVESQQRKRPEFGAAKEEIAGGWAFYTAPGSPMNHAIGIGLNGAVTREQFDRLEEFYSSRNTPCEIVASPYADMSLFEHAGARGYAITEFNSVLVRDLNTFEPVTLPSHIRIDPVCEKLEAWSDALVEGFSEIAELPPELFQPFAEIENHLCAVARVDGVVAGATGGAIFRDAGIAAFYGTATKQNFRRRGVQTALLQWRLAASKRAGCDVAIVMTQPGSQSQRNAESVGFRVAYTKVVLVRNFM